jgi:hypothetical protein
LPEDLLLYDKLIPATAFVAATTFLMKCCRAAYGFSLLPRSEFISQIFFGVEAKFF